MISSCSQTSPSRTSMALVGNFENFTEEVKQEFEEWTKSEEAKQIFLETAEKAQRESDDFIQRNTPDFIIAPLPSDPSLVWKNIT